MTFSEWSEELKTLETELDVATNVYESARFKLDLFLRDTIGFAHNDVATLHGTVTMVAKVFEMKKAEDQK